MDKLKLRLAHLMRGRYGMDALYRSMMVLTMILLVLNLFVPRPLFYLLALGLALLSFYRAFSRNIEKRRAENQRFLMLSGNINKKLMQLRNRFRDRKTHVYTNCPSCRQLLRLPRKPGVNHVTCPQCKQEFDLNIKG